PPLSPPLSLPDALPIFTDQSTGQGEDFLHRFLGQDRTPGGDSPEQRNGRGVFVTGLVGGEFGRSGAAGATQFHRSRSVLVTVEVALVLKHLELVRDAGGAGQPDRVADLPDGGRKAAVLQIPLKEVQDALLTSGEFGCWGRGIRWVLHGSDNGCGLHGGGNLLRHGRASSVFGSVRACCGLPPPERPR